MSAAAGFGLARAIQGLAAGGTNLIEGLQRNEASRAKSLYNSYMEDKIAADALDAERMDMGLESVRSLAQKDPIAAAAILGDYGLKPAAILPFEDWTKHRDEPAQTSQQVAQAPVAQAPAGPDAMTQSLAASTLSSAATPSPSAPATPQSVQPSMEQTLSGSKPNPSPSDRLFEGRDALVGVLGQKTPATAAAERALYEARARYTAISRSPYKDKESMDMARDAVKTASDVLKETRAAGNDVVSRKVDVGQGFQTQEGMDYRQGQSLQSAADLQALRLKADVLKTRMQEAGKDRRKQAQIEADGKLVKAESDARLRALKAEEATIDKAERTYLDPKIPDHKKAEVLDAAKIRYKLQDKWGDDKNPVLGKLKIESANFAEARDRIRSQRKEVEATNNQLRSINRRDPVEESDGETSPNADYIPDAWKEESPAEKPKGKSKGFLDPSRPR